jgi:S-adenosylmethionine synthetase
MARYVAKNVVAAGLADKAMIQLAYAIGVASPVSFMIDAYGTEKVPLDELEKAILKEFDLRPAAIIERLNLKRPIYRQTASYGHFGRNDLNLPWEKLDAVENLKESFNL